MGPAHLYAHRFPLSYPTRESFLRVVLRDTKSGSLRPTPGHHEGAIRPREIVELQEEILNVVKEQPDISTRTIASQFAISQVTVCRIVRQDLLYPFQMQWVQALLSTDLPVRENFH